MFPEGRWEYPQIQSCPKCGFGSAYADERYAGLSEWHSRTCDQCKGDFTGAEAVDEAFVRGHAPDLAKWAGVHLVSYGIRCLSGTSEVIAVHGEFDRVYRVEALGASGILAGGVSVIHVAQGYLMVAVAPIAEERDPVSVDLLVHAVGTRSPQQRLPPWKETLMRARLDADTAPEFAVISAVNAIDLFIEERVTQHRLGSGRPASWNRALTQARLPELGKLMDAAHADLAALVEIRNEVAHGRRPDGSIPERLRSRQSKWREDGRNYDPYSFIAPFATFSLQVALATIRSIRAQLAERDAR